eukprot:389790_1
MTDEECESGMVGDTGFQKVDIACKTEETWDAVNILKITEPSILVEDKAPDDLVFASDFYSQVSFTQEIWKHVTDTFEVGAAMRNGTSGLVADMDSALETDAW